MRRGLRAAAGSARGESPRPGGERPSRPGPVSCPGPPSPAQSPLVETPRLKVLGIPDCLVGMAGTQDGTATHLLEFGDNVELEEEAYCYQKDLSI